MPRLASQLGPYNNPLPREPDYNPYLEDEYFEQRKSEILDCRVLLAEAMAKLEMPITTDCAAAIRASKRRELTPAESRMVVAWAYEMAEQAAHQMADDDVEAIKKERG